MGTPASLRGGSAHQPREFDGDTSQFLLVGRAIGDIDAVEHGGEFAGFAPGDTQGVTTRVGAASLVDAFCDVADDRVRRALTLVAQMGSTRGKGES